MDLPGDLSCCMSADGSFMQYVQISPVTILQAMLKNMHLPCPEYTSQVAGEDSFTTKVVFYPSMSFLRSSSHPYSMCSYPMPTLQAAKRCAARMALIHMEKVEKTVPSAFTIFDLDEEKKKPPSSLNMDIALPNQLAAAHDETRSISSAALLPTAPLQDLCGPGSPGSSSSTTNQLRTLAQKNPRVIRIPLRILLNIMLEQLGVSKAEYHLHMCEGSKVRVTVLFNTSTLPVEGAPVYLSMSGIESESYEIAEDSASIQAITYVEEATNTIIKDLSYGRLIEVKGQNKILLHKLKKAHEYKKQLARGWFLSVRHMSSFSRQVLNITYLNYYAGQDFGDTLWKNLLTNFQDLGFRLKHAGNVLEKRLEKMRKDNFS